MAAHKRVFAPELIADAKRLYENTATPVRDIAAMLGVCNSTLTHRANEWLWRKRAHAGTSVDLVRMVRGAVAADLTAPRDASDEGCAQPVSPQQRAALAQRIQSVVERELGVVEQIVGILKPTDKAEAESVVRTLAGISRTLREIAALNQPDNEMPHDEPDEPARDIEEFREEILHEGFAELLHTCPQQAWVSFHRTVRSFLDLPDDLMVYSGMALGYEDPHAPINGWRSPRAALDDFASFDGFES